MRSSMKSSNSRIDALSTPRFWNVRGRIAVDVVKMPQYRAAAPVPVA